MLGILAGAVAMAPLAMGTLSSGLEVDYSAPAGCPDASAFHAEIASRLAAPTVEHAAPARLRVRIREVEASFQGRLELEAEGQSTERQITSANCSELTRALALVAAVLLNPEPSEGNASVTAQGMGGTEALPAPAPAVPKRPITKSRSSPVGSATGAQRVAFTARVGASLQTGALPQLWLSPRVALGVEVWSSQRWGAGLALSATWPGNREVTVQESRATIGLTVARFEACASLRNRRVATVTGCGLFTGGRIRGSSALDPTTRREKWLTPGLLVRAERQLLGPLALFAEGSVGWPLVRTTFFLDRATPPRTEAAVYEVPAQVFGADVGLLLRFE